MGNELGDLTQGVALTPLDEPFRTDPYPLLARLRSEAPVHDDAVRKRFIYTRHDDVRDILRDRDFWTDPRKANPGTFTREFLGGGVDEEPLMLFMDEPGHRRLRTLVSGSFTPPAVERWRPPVRGVVAEMLGIDPSRYGDFKTSSDQSVTVGFNPFATPSRR